MDQHPGRPLGRPRPLAASRRRAPAQARLGQDTQDFWAPYVLRDGDRYLMYYSATPDVCDVPERGHCLAIAVVDIARRPVHRHGPAAAARPRLRIYRSDGVRRPGERQATALLGIGLPADQGPGTGRGPMSFAPGSEPVDLVWPNPVEGRFPAARRGVLGHPPRRFLLSLLFGRQLLRAGRRIWRDGRALARARPGRSRRSSRRAASPTA